jgi:transposase
LTDWRAQVEASGRRARILNYFDGWHSRGFAEGVNLKVKLINRRGFGYRNFDNFRLHVLTAFGQ